MRALFARLFSGGAPQRPRSGRPAAPPALPAVPQPDVYDKLIADREAVRRAEARRAA